MITVKVKPLSTNEAWQGRRFKTKKYSSFEKEVLMKLKPMKLPNHPYKVNLEFGFSNKASDIDNPVKMVIDCLSKKFKFNDKEIYQLTIVKTIVKKGEEFFSFEIKTYE